MLFGKPLYVLTQQKKAKKAVFNNMSVQINIQTDKTEIRSKSDNDNTIDYVKNGDVSHDDIDFRNLNHDEVSYFVFLLLVFNYI